MLNCIQYNTDRGREHHMPIGSGRACALATAGGGFCAGVGATRGAEVESPEGVGCVSGTEGSSVASQPGTEAVTW